jgi:bacillopeptidase F
LQQVGKSDEYVNINVFLFSNQSLDELSLKLDKEKASFDSRIKSVSSFLKSNAKISQTDFLNFLEQITNSDKNAVTGVESYWVVNMLNLTVKKNIVYQIAENKDIRFIDLNSPRYKIEDVVKQVNLTEKSVNGAEPGLKIINAHKLWQLGYSGRNVLFLSMDTGVFPDHPAISDNFAGNHFPMSQCWYGMRNLEPVDHASSSHGTHTTGTVLGLDAANNDTIGVAFNAMWIATDPVASTDAELLSPTDFMNVYEWVLDPDSNPETTDDVPRVINNSWGYDYSQAAGFGACEMVEAEVYITLEVAGICSPFSAGNDGPGASTIGFPAQRAFNEVNPMAVGALNFNNTIASFSSIGPTPCIDEEGSLKIKPEVSAPGVDIRSCAGRDSYALLSGTSMACPHVSGALLLLSEAFPIATAYELKYALYQTAVDLGVAGEDNTFGRGLIDVFAAYNLLAETYTPVPPVQNDYDLSVEIVSPTLNIICPEQSNFVSEIKIKNTGLEPIDTFNLKLFLNEVLLLDTVIDVILNSDQEFVFTTEQYSFAFGKNYLHAIAKPIHNYNEYDRYNNATIRKYYVIVDDVFPFANDFETFNTDISNSNWLIINPDNLKTWQTLNWGDTDQYKAIGVNFNQYGSRLWEEDYANLPKISMPNTEPLFLNFTYAYKKRVETLYKDSLLVQVSTDCGLTFPNTIYRNGGIDLATVDGNAGLNVYKPINVSEFDTISLSLDAFKSQDVVIRFVSKNDRGSAIYIDKVDISNQVLGAISNNMKIETEISVFPNPCNLNINYKITNLQLKTCSLQITDITGKLIKSMNINKLEGEIDISDFPQGIYFMSFGSYEFNHVLRFVKL